MDVFEQAKECFLYDNSELYHLPDDQVQYKINFAQKICNKLLSENLEITWLYIHLNLIDIFFKFQGRTFEYSYSIDDPDHEEYVYLKGYHGADVENMSIRETCNLVLAQNGLLLDNLALVSL